MFLSIRDPLAALNKSSTQPIGTTAASCNHFCTSLRIYLFNNVDNVQRMWTFAFEWSLPWKAKEFSWLSIKFQKSSPSFCFGHPVFVWAIESLLVQCKNYNVRLIKTRLPLLYLPIGCAFRNWWTLWRRHLFENICADVHKRASKWNLNLICCDVTLRRANWRLLWSKPSTWTLFTYPLGPGGFHYKRPHYLWVTQSNLQALLVSQLGRSDLCMLMSHPLCGAGRILGQRDNDNRTKPKCISVFGVFITGGKWKILQSSIDLLCIKGFSICFF